VDPSLAKPARLLGLLLDLPLAAAPAVAVPALFPAEAIGATFIALASNLRFCS